MKSPDIRLHILILGEIFIFQGNCMINLKATLHEAIDFDSRDGLAEHVREVQNLCNRVKKRLDNSYQVSAKRYNLRTWLVILVKGQVVWKRNYVLSDVANYFAAKLAPKFTKCIVDEKITPNVYRLLDFTTKKYPGQWYVKDMKLDT